jgi:hypothetical protein
MHTWLDISSVECLCEPIESSGPLTVQGSGAGLDASTQRGTMPAGRVAAPYSLPGNMKEDGPAVLCRKQALQATMAVAAKPKQQQVTQYPTPSFRLLDAGY